MELLRRTKEGDKQAREELISGNLRLVLSVIQRFASRGENADDLFQVGCVGLIKAIDNFDITQPVRFSTYGVPMIVGEIRRYLRDNSAIRVSRSMRDTAYKVMQARERLMAQSQREPTVEQLAAELGIPREDVVFAMDAIVDPVSLFEPVYSDGGDTVCVMDQVKDVKNTAPAGAKLLRRDFHSDILLDGLQGVLLQAAHLGLGDAHLRGGCAYVGKCRERGLLLGQILVNGLGGSLARAHGQDDRGRAGDRVAAGVHRLAAGEALLVDDDAQEWLRLRPEVRGDGAGRARRLRPPPSHCQGGQRV